MISFTPNSSTSYMSIFYSIVRYLIILTARGTNPQALRPHPQQLRQCATTGRSSVIVDKTPFSLPRMATISRNMLLHSQFPCTTVMFAHRCRTCQFDSGFRPVVSDQLCPKTPEIRSSILCPFKSIAPRLCERR